MVICKACQHASFTPMRMLKSSDLQCALFTKGDFGDVIVMEIYYENRIICESDSTTTLYGCMKQ